MIKVSNVTSAILISVCFFVVSLVTLSDYGINWDTINHLPRGQAYLHFFLTGKTDFSDLPKWVWYWQKSDSLFLDSNTPKNQLPRRSLYQSDGTTYDWFISHESGGHPPVSDILAAIFNFVFFNNLRLINDIDSYRIYSVFLSAALVGLIFWWVSHSYGRFAGLISAASLSLYPLFWSEAHFNNEKDVPETVYWAFILFCLWQGVSQRSWRWLAGGGVFLGLALGTKFNVFFIGLVIIPWLIALIIPRLKQVRVLDYINQNRLFLLSFLLIPVIGLVIFLASWPYLWPDPIGHIYKVVRFYKDIGLTVNKDARFLGPLGINTYPIQWILYTTPVITLVLALVGLLASWAKIKLEKYQQTLLFLLWLLVPVARVTYPGATVYGGIRQIMEYLPALCIFSGLGAVVIRDYLSNHFKILNKAVVSLLIILAFVPITIKLIQIHPNENVYFNFLIGGLKGAKDRDFPSWGNTFGAAYRQGINWINKNAQSGSNLVMAYELAPNIPNIFIRPDINFQNRNRSGFWRQGEYAITLVYQGTKDRSYYDSYLENFLEPVYSVAVDGVAILKVWKNDPANLKLALTEEVMSSVVLSKTDYGLAFDLGREVKLSRLEINYDQTSCAELTRGIVQISKDSVNWVTLPGVLPNAWRVSIMGVQPFDGHFIEPFVAQNARFIRLDLSPTDTCLKNVRDFKLYRFK